jgi:hypothetical protein
MADKKENRFYQIRRTANRERRAQRIAEILGINLSGGTGTADLFDAMIDYINGQFVRPASGQAEGEE